MTTKAELKTFFENGDVPGQEQFWEWMDSYWHKEEAIDAASTQYSNTQLTQYQVGGGPLGPHSTGCRYRRCLTSYSMVNSNVLSQSRQHRQMRS